MFFFLDLNLIYQDYVAKIRFYLRLSPTFLLHAVNLEMKIRQRMIKTPEMKIIIYCVLVVPSDGLPRAICARFFVENYLPHSTEDGESSTLQWFAHERCVKKRPRAEQREEQEHVPCALTQEHWSITKELLL